MYIVLMGPQGAGKGEQANRLAPRYGLMKIATGELFRAEIAAETELGKLVAGTLKAGKLVADETTLAIVEERLSAIDHGAARGAVFDGFPRNKVQAQALDKSLAGRDHSIDLVIEIDVPDSVIVERLEGRRVCASCGRTYHVKYNPPAIDGVCDVCGGSVAQRRDDDNEAAIRSRLETYRTETTPLLEYYGSPGIVRKVDGNQSMDDVERQIDALLDRIPAERSR